MFADVVRMLGPLALLSLLLLVLVFELRVGAL